MQKNQKILIAIVGILVVLAGVIGFLAFQKEKKEAPKVKINKFKEEYEKLNGVVDGEGYTYPTVDIDVNSKIEYADEQKVLDILDSEGIIYFGTATSFECRNAVSMLVKAADSLSITKLYYVDTNKLDSTKEEYKEILDKLDEVLEKEETTNELGEKVATVSRRMIIPTVVVVKKGEIIDYHVGGYEKENNKEELTKEEQEDLFLTYTGKLFKLSSSSCNEVSKC